MDNIKHLIISIGLALISLLVGIIGYALIENWDLMDSLYMTIITLSTVGYSEVHSMSPKGRIFTMFLVFFGVGFSLYVAGVIVQFMVEGRIRHLMGRRRLDRKIKRIKNHFIVCGYGRIGRVLSNQLRNEGMDVVVIEKDKDLVQAMDEDGVLYISGDASDEANLTKAGIDRARGLVAVLATDNDNVFLVLTARQLNAELLIVARASRGRAENKLRAAGATKVESPYEMGAINMAQRIMRPTVTSFLELALEQNRSDVQMEEIPVSYQSELVDVQLKDSGIRQRFNLIIIAIKKGDGHMSFNPSFEARLRGGETVIAVGGKRNLQSLRKILAVESY